MSQILFLGTPDFAACSLQALFDFCQQNQHTLLGAVCQPDRPAERGQHLKAPPVKTLALKLGLAVWQPDKITPDLIDWFQKQQIDLAVVVVYGKILPKSLLGAAKLGFVNVHPSLLPRWRGAAPIQRAIQAGDTQTGVCIMNLVPEMDAGEIYDSIQIPIEPQETSGELFDRLAVIGADLLVKTLPGILNQKTPKIAQSQTGITYAHKLKKEEALIDWNKSALELVNHYRAMQPWPGVYGFYQGRKIRLFEAEISPSSSLSKGQIRPGQIEELGDKLVVGTGEGLIAFGEAQLEGKRRMPIRDWLNGFSMQVGGYLC